MSELTLARRGATWSKPSWHRFLWKVGCALFGHHVNNRAFDRAQGRGKSCRCGITFLAEDGRETRISHTASCFLLGHRYVKAGEREGYHEYVCARCGHPLLLEAGRDPHAESQTFRKKVRYLCNLFGHRVRRVAARGGLTEYACHCGHCFLKREGQLETVQHPARCLFAGHYVSFVERRNGYGEYVCRHCGHTFCFTVND